MKVAVLVLALVALVVASEAAQINRRAGQVGNHADFQDYIKKYNKKYANDVEYRVRFANYQASKTRVEALNAEEPNKPYGLTKFSDLSKEEFRATMLGRKITPHAKVPNMASPVVDTLGGLPPSYDWRQHGAISAVKDQEQCGSCWAFSATEEIESNWFLAGHPLPNLAPQQIVDCDTTDYGCDGGDTPTAYEYVIKAGGLESETAYPYTAADGHCKFSASKVVAKVSNWTYVTQNKNETEMAYFVANHAPVSICVEADTWQDYNGGVITKNCGDNLDHCVQIVGFDSQASSDGTFVPYWIIRNSWNTDWGEEGYIYVEIGKNLCGVGEEVTVTYSPH